MTEPGGDDDVGPLVADLVTTLRDLESEFEPTTEGGLPRPPSPRELMRFTSDVAIPGAILMLRTNVEALKLLQRALRLADGRSPTTGAGGETVRRRAERLSEATLSRLDGALADLQDAVEGVPEHEETRDLLAEARELRDDVQAKIREEGPEGTDTEDPAEEVADPLPSADDVPIDVDAELRSLKREVDGDDGVDGNGRGDDAGGRDGDDGSTSGDDAGDDSTGDEPRSE